MTENATRFITPLTLQTLSRRRVLHRAFDLASEETIQHIDLTRRIAALVVAPADRELPGQVRRRHRRRSAVHVLHLGHGTGGRCPGDEYPHVAASFDPGQSASTDAAGVQVVEPDSGWLAEGEIGWGRLADPERIVSSALAAARRSTQLEGKTVVVTAGPTREAIDPVRYISNRSSARWATRLRRRRRAVGRE